MKIAVLTAYGDAVASGRLSPQDEVSLADWERWYLPGTDGGAHPKALEELGVGEVATLDQVVEAMIRFSDNAATDLVLERVGLEQVDATLARLGVDMDPLHPLLGEFLLFGSELTRADDLRAESIAAVARWEEAGRPDPDLGGLGAQIEGTDRLDHRASVLAFATLLSAIHGEDLSPVARERIHYHLEWPARTGRGSDTVERLGTKGGSLPGVLTEAMYVVPKAGPQVGQTRIVVLFMEDMSMAAWFASMQSFAHQQLMLRVAVDTAVERDLAVALSGDGGGDVVPTATPEVVEPPAETEPAEE